MIIGIDASNIRAGGGVTHLVELLRAADPLAHGFSKVIIWSGKGTLSRIENRHWLEKSYHPILDKGLPSRIFWQRFTLSRLARDAGCDVLYVPGGSYAGNFRPIVTLSQNLLPFEWRELRRYGWSRATVKMLLLRWTQSRTFRRAEGLMFLTRYAQDAVMRVIKQCCGVTAIVPHGIDARFLCPPREQQAVESYLTNRPFRILYVSVIDQYKHQWHVVEAIAQLRKTGLPVELNLVGPAVPAALQRLKASLDKFDPTGEFVHYSGGVPHDELHESYKQADLCLFASSCENLPNILLEGMASGLPIASSNRGPMPEVLGTAGLYFDPEKPAEIAAAIEKLLVNPELRFQLANKSFGIVHKYSWQRCADETFSFIAQICRNKVDKALSK